MNLLPFFLRQFFEEVVRRLVPEVRHEVLLPVQVPVEVPVQVTVQEPVHAKMLHLLVQVQLLRSAVQTKPSSRGGWDEVELERREMQCTHPAMIGGECRLRNARGGEWECCLVHSGMPKHARAFKSGDYVIYPVGFPLVEEGQPANCCIYCFRTCLVCLAQSL